MVSAQVSPQQTDDEGAPPALFEHCRNTYNAMLREGKTVVTVSQREIEGSGDDTSETIVVYEGFLTHLVTQQLNLSVPYYTTIRRSLLRMGCIRQLKRGGGSSPSQWELIYEPTEEAFRNAQEPKKRKPDKNEALQEQIRNLSARVSELEDWREAVNDMLVEHFGAEPEIQ